MGYVSLYRKWRPQTFEEVVGQEHITRTLKNAVKETQVSHAYLFAGPRGTGKTSVAKILAKAINCEKGPTPTPCNKCRFCKAITAGSSIDVVEIDAASNRGIDEIRDLREKVRFVPAEAGVKVYIVDEVHMLTTEAFNALLKMLEEPPAHVVFVLATTEPYRILPTILSRCQRFDFHRISTDKLIERLKKIAESEKIEIDEPSLSLIARSAHGSMRDAISTLDQLAAFTGKKIKLVDVTTLLGMVESDLLFEMSDAVAAKDAAKALELVEKIADSGRDLRQFVKDLTEHMRKLFIIQNAEKAEKIINTTPEEFKRLEAQANRLKEGWVIARVAELSGLLSELRYTTDARLLLELGLVKMIRAGDSESLDALAKKVAELEKRIDAGPKEMKNKKPVPSEVEGSKIKNEKPSAIGHTPSARSASGTQHPASDAELARLARVWDVVRKQVRDKKISTYALIIECEPAGLSGNTVSLRFNGKASFHKKEVEKEANRRLIEETLSQVWGKPLKVVCTLAEGEEEAEKPKPKGDQDVVEVLMENFGAKVLEEKEEQEP